jgi:Na+-translocating ferredoxin:NAD+ oxidoreductase RnfC subunit
MKEIAEKAYQAGVIGAGGGGFPSHIKLEAEAELAIANGAECEPLLYGDSYLIKTDPELLVLGLSLLGRAVGAKRKVITIKGKNDEAIAAISPFLEREGIELFTLGDYYPAGDEALVVYEVTGRVIPEGGIPLDLSVVVNNVETLINLARAQKGKPVVEKLITVAGEVAEPTLVRAPIGIAIGELIAAAGGATSSPYAIIAGGPLMGKLADDDEPIGKTTNGVIVLPEEHPLVLMRKASLSITLNRAHSACSQCRDCTELCPRFLIGHNLKPHLIMRAVSLGLDWDVASISSALLCSECGLCELYACPMGLYPRRVITEVKKELLAQGIKKVTGKEKLLPPKLNDRKVPLSRLVGRSGLLKYIEKKPKTPPLKVVPSQVKINLAEHTGVPAEPMVKIGDKVATGQLIGRSPEGKPGTSYHASITGVVKRMENGFIVIEGER